MDTLPSIPPVKSPTSKRSFILPLFILLFLAIVSIVVVIYLSNKTKSSDTRSRASQQNRARLELVKDVSWDEEHPVYVVVLDGSDLLNSTSVTSITAVVKLAAKDVLGATTDKRAHEALGISKQANTRKVLPTPRTTIPCYNTVATVSGKLVWPTSCKGLPDSNCSTGQVELTSEEIDRYSHWNRFGRPSLPGCGMGKPTVTSTPIASPTLKTTEPVLLLDTEHVRVTTNQSDIFTFSTPTLNPDTGTKTRTLTLQAKVTHPLAVESQIPLHQKVAIAKISIFNSELEAAENLLIQSVKGYTSVAPGIDIELLETKTQLASPSASPSATPL